MATPTQRMQLRYVHAQPPLVIDRLENNVSHVITDPLPLQVRERVGSSYVE